MITSWTDIKSLDMAFMHACKVKDFTGRHNTLLVCMHNVIRNKKKR